MIQFFFVPLYCENYKVFLTIKFIIMTKKQFVRSKIVNHTCFYSLKGGYVSLSYFSPSNSVYYVYHSFDDADVREGCFISLNSAINRVLRHFSSFSFS